MGRIVAILGQVAVRFLPGQSSEGPQRPGQKTGMGEQRPNRGFSGATGRAALVALAVVLPALIVPSTPPEMAQVLLLLAIFAGAVVLAEYASSFPALIEFRFAAPFNRTRFVLVALTVAMLSVLQRGTEMPGPLTDLVSGMASACARVLDVPYGPIRQLTAFMPETLTLAQLALIRDGAALALTLALSVIAGFVTAIRLNVWPMGQGPFNVWINLPTFDPTAGNDVVQRLLRHARINVSLGILMPFVLPGVLMVSAAMAQPINLGNPVTFVWGITLWAFIPAALVMRGVAMARVARMIRANRRRFADGEASGYATV